MFGYKLRDLPSTVSPFMKMDLNFIQIFRPSVGNRSIIINTAQHNVTNRNPNGNWHIQKTQFHELQIEISHFSKTNQAYDRLELIIYACWFDDQIMINFNRLD